MEISKKNQKEYRKKIAEFQLAKSNFKKPIKYRVEFTNVKLFFSSSKEILYRFLIIISQIIFAFAIILNGFLLSYAITNLIPNGDDMRISQIIFRILTLFFCFIPVLIILFFILPIVMCSRLGSLKNWCITFLIYGSWFYFISIGLYILNIFLLQKIVTEITISSFIKIFPGILLGVSLFLMWISSLWLLSLTNKRIKQCEQSLFEINEYNKVRIN